MKKVLCFFYPDFNIFLDFCLTNSLQQMRDLEMEKERISEDLSPVRIYRICTVGCMLDDRHLLNEWTKEVSNIENIV